MSSGQAHTVVAESEAAPEPAALALPSDADPQASARREAAHELWQRIAEAPWQHDLFAALRRLQALHPELPGLGSAPRPHLEPVRLGQEPSSSFAPAALASVDLRATLPPKLRVYSFGLFGPNGPLPLAYTEYAHERAIHAGDRALVDFADLFHHRFLLLFFRAWAQAQSTASLDRAGHDSFSRYVASLIGLGLPGQAEADSVPLHARLGSAGHQVRQARNAEGLACLLASFFNVPVAVEQHRGRWLPVPTDQRSRLGAMQGAQLGVDAVAAAAVWDRQHHVRVVVGPLSLREYESLLPDRRGALQLRDWVRGYLGIEFDWDLQLVLRRDEVPGAQLGGSARLGWTSWLGDSPRDADRGDYCYPPEHHHRVQAQAA
ncbi:MAG: type VI secretion system baseplate subunit TssG [Xanthomonadales bacterium]|nr:type VI secretion system baseplate subunit TssG [Xanthomonadales bacterium]